MLTDRIDARFAAGSPVKLTVSAALSFTVTATHRTPLPVSMADIHTRGCGGGDLGVLF